MSAHHIKHTVTCPAYGNQELKKCTCGAPGAEKAKANAEAREKSAAALQKQAEQRQRIYEAGVKRDEEIRGQLRNAWHSMRKAQGKQEIEDEAGNIAEGVPAGGLSLESADNQVLQYVTEAVAAMSGRMISLTRHDNWVSNNDLALVIHQICPICREYHKTTVGQGDHHDVLMIAALVGAEARRVRMRHRCPTVPVVLSKITSSEDMVAVASELERDGTEMVKLSEIVMRAAEERATQEAQTKAGVQ